MNTTLINQAVAALLRDGTCKMTAEQIAAALTPIEVPAGAAFIGVAHPNLKPGTAPIPAIYAAVAGGWYPSFSNLQVNESQLVLFITTNGEDWTATIAADGHDGRYVLKTAVVTELTAQSTDEQVPSAKCVYDLVGDVEAALAAI